MAMSLTVGLKLIALQDTAEQVGGVVSMIETMTTLVVNVSRVSTVEIEPFIMPTLVLVRVQPLFSHFEYMHNNIFILSDCGRHSICQGTALSFLFWVYHA